MVIYNIPESSKFEVIYNSYEYVAINGAIINYVTYKPYASVINL